MKRDDTDFYEGLFNKDFMLDVIESHSLQTSMHMNVVNYKNGIKSTIQVGEIADRSEIAGALENGATVQFFQPQRYSDPLWTIQSALEAPFSSFFRLYTFFPFVLKTCP